MIVLLPALILFFLVLIFAGIRLAPMFGGNSQRLEMILSDESLADRYRPMARLLREDDWTYLASQPGFAPSHIRAIRSKRRAIFRKYLSCLSGDFASICLLVRALMVQSDVPRPDLEKAVFRCQLAFATSLLRVEYCLITHAVGITSVTMDISGLLSTLDEIGEQVRSLRISPEPLAA